MDKPKKVFCRNCECAELREHSCGISFFFCHRHAPALDYDCEYVWPSSGIEDFCFEGIETEKVEEVNNPCPKCNGTDSKGFLEFYPTAPQFSHNLQHVRYSKHLHDSLIMMGNHITKVVLPCPACSDKKEKSE